MRKSTVTTKIAAAAAASLVCGLATTNASALTVSTINSTVGIESTLTNALVASGGGVSVVAGSATYQGVNTANNQQSATYSGFNLAPSSGSTPTLSLANGIFLTSGNANIPLTNTVNEFDANLGAVGNAQLSTLSGQATFDANVLSFNFNVGAGQNSVSAQFVFGTDEFPTQTVTDIFGFFVDGVNFAKFAGGELSNPVGGGLYGIEYNGLTQVFTVTGLLGAANSDGSHTLTVGVADTIDHIYDSGVFITSLKAGTSTDGGGITPGVPEPETYALMLAGLAVLGGVVRRKKQADKAA
jgi:PEP-CTERM motif